MKFKDIEKKLKNEQSKTAVPDVYARVSKAPLNKLMKGETPAKAFQKQTAMRLLIFVLAIFLVAAIGLSAMWLAPTDRQSVPNCYVSVTVTREGADTRIGLVMSGGKNVITAVEEMTNGSVNTKPIVSHSSHITDFISPKANDKVSIAILSNEGNTIVDCARNISDELQILYYGLQFEMTTNTYSSAIRTSLAEYIAACGGSVTSNSDTKSLIQAYAELFA